MARKIPIRQRIEEHLRVGREDIAAYTDRSNVGQQLYDIFYWQEVLHKATEELKHAWDRAQRQEGGLIDTDEDLREMGKGEHIVTESEKFTCVVTVQDPRRNLNPSALIEEVCKKFKTKPQVVEGLIETAKLPTKAPLQKRIVEA
jgi:hypothetical protein